MEHKEPERGPRQEKAKGGPPAEARGREYLGGRGTTLTNPAGHCMSSLVLSTGTLWHFRGDGSRKSDSRELKGLWRVRGCRQQGREGRQCMGDRLTMGPRARSPFGGKDFLLKRQVRDKVLRRDASTRMW